jgi:hypothetical protein
MADSPKTTVRPPSPILAGSNRERAKIRYLDLDIQFGGSILLENDRGLRRMVFAEAAAL